MPAVTHIMAIIATIGIHMVMSHPVRAMFIVVPAWRLNIDQGSVSISVAVDVWGGVMAKTVGRSIFGIKMM